MSAYYNENDPFAAQWLRKLIKAGHIAPGDVDTRSIEDVTPVDLKPYDQCHFFAGIGVWSYALRQARWPDNKPVWTGSCPCQPFSAAGKRAGAGDDRDLWWAFFWLIQQCRPETVFGEQVSSKDGLTWWDTVQTDLEGAGYAAATFDLCAAGVGAPHIRQRLYWVADAGHLRWGNRTKPEESQFAAPSRRSIGVGKLADATVQGLERQCDCGSIGEGDEEPGRISISSENCSNDELADAANVGHERAGSARDQRAGSADDCGASWPSPLNGHWRAADWLYCRDDRWRPVEPGTFPLVDGAPARVGRLRGYGNAIVPQVAQAFIEAYQEVIC